MGKPALRIGDLTAHGGTVVVGKPTILIGKMPASTLGDMHVCPMLTGPVPHVGGPAIMGSTGVLLSKMPAARVSDPHVCVGPPSMGAMGCMTVLIGEAGSGGDAGNAAVAASAASMRKNGPKAISPFPVAEQPTPRTENHYLECTVTDNADFVLPGIKYKIKDPYGKDIVGSSSFQGRVRHGGYVQAGSFKVEFPAIAKVKWPSLKLKPHEKLKLEASVTGIKDGTEAFISIFEERDRGKYKRLLVDLKGKVSSGKVEVEWTFEKECYPLPPMDESKMHALEEKPEGKIEYFFFVVIEGCIGVSKKAQFLDDAEIRVVDKDNKPMAHEKYVARLVDGSVRKGKLDKDGKAKEKDIPVGHYVLNLVNLVKSLKTVKKPDPVVYTNDKVARRKKGAKAEKASEKKSARNLDRPDQNKETQRTNDGSIIHVGIFFDGTKNNRDHDRPLKYDTNVSKLYDLYNGDGNTRYKFYLEGVGTGSLMTSDAASGGFSGRGIYERIYRAEKNLKDVIQKHPGSEIRLSIFGFSRGAATALAFINHLFFLDGGKQSQSMADPNPSILGGQPTKPDYVSSGAEIKSKLQFEKVWFLGIFDAVASIGRPGDEQEYTHDLSVRRSRINHLTHFIARDEMRQLFPLTSVHRGHGTPLPSGWEERIFPGVHADVGGGYQETEQSTEFEIHDQSQQTTRAVSHVNKKKGDYLSRVTGWAMFEAAKKANLPMYEVNFIDASHSSDSSGVDEILKQGKLQVSAENGWVIYELIDDRVDEDNKKRVKITLDLLSIPPELASLWKARASESDFNRLINSHHPDYEANIKPFIKDIEFWTHDSLGLMDPKGLGKKLGASPSPRSIFYRGSAE